MENCVLKLRELPLKNFLQIVTKLNVNDLVKIRRCTKKLNDLIEENRFEISRNSRHNNTAIDVALYDDKFQIEYREHNGHLEQPYEQVSALAFERIHLRLCNKMPTAPDVLNRLRDLLLRLNLVTRTLNINGFQDLQQARPTAEFELGALITYRRLECHFAIYGTPVNMYSSNNPFDDLYVDVRFEKKEEFLAQTFFEAIKNKKSVEIKFHFRVEFVMQSIDYIITKLSSSNFPTFPFTCLKWTCKVAPYEIPYSSYWPYESDLSLNEFKHIWKKVTNACEPSVDDIYAKALPSQIVILTLYYNTIDNNKRCFKLFVIFRRTTKLKRKSWIVFIYKLLTENILFFEFWNCTE